MGRFTRSFQLVGQSARVLMQDKELMILPVLSGLISAVVLASFFVSFGLGSVALSHPQPILAVPFFLMYVAMYFIGIFFHAAVIAGATERLRGGTPTLSSALSAASRRAGPILVWALATATVGALLRLLRGRGRFVEDLIVGLLGAAWSLATFFVVPVLVFEDVSLGQCVRRSLDLIKKTWGESIIGTEGVGLVALAGWIVLALVVALLVEIHVVPIAIVVGVVGAVLLVASFSALSGIYVAALYQYATTGTVGDRLNPDLLAGAFRSR